MRDTALLSQDLWTHVSLLYWIKPPPAHLSKRDSSVESSVESTILPDGLNSDSLAGRSSSIEALCLLEWLGAGDVKVDLALDLGVLRLGQCLSSLEALGAWLGESALSATGAAVSLGSRAWVLLRAWALFRAAGVFPGGTAVSLGASGATVLSVARPGAASPPSSQVRSWPKSATTAPEETPTTAWSRSAVGSIWARWFTARMLGWARMLGAREARAWMLLGAAGVLGAVMATAFFAWLSAAATVMAWRSALLNSSFKSTFVSSTIAVISN